MISLTSLDSLFKVICKSYWFKPSKIFQISNQATFLWINPESSDDFLLMETIPSVNCPEKQL